MCVCRWVGGWVHACVCACVRVCVQKEQGVDSTMKYTLFDFYFSFYC